MSVSQQIKANDTHLLPTTTSATTNNEIQKRNTAIDNQNSVNMVNNTQTGGSATGAEGKVEIDAEAAAGFEDTVSNAIQQNNQAAVDATNDHKIDISNFDLFFLNFEYILLAYLFYLYEFGKYF